MKKLIETLKNIWKIEDLRQRLLITLLFVAIYRFGSFVVLPGINPAMLSQLQSQTAGGLMSLLDMFSGGAFSNASIFALGIMPYISASIVMQLLAVAVPYVQKMQREGESGRKKISMYTRWLTVAILLFQAPGYLMNLKMQAGAALAQGISWSVFMVPAVIILSAGSMFILWLGERITDKGIGNGISLIIRSCLCIDCSGTGCPQGARTVCEAHRRQPAGGRRPPVYPPEAVRSQRDAYHLCPGTDVHPADARAVFGSGECQLVCAHDA